MPAILNRAGELNASNEELQSTNEELETATEELQSVNEELITANSELEGKVVELTDSTNDLNDLIHNIDVGIIFLDRGLRIQRFTPQVKRFINLISGDIGRPLSDLVSKFEYDGMLLTDAQKVLDTLQPLRVEVKAFDNNWYLITLKPYLTGEGAIVGVVVTFLDITQQKLAQHHFEELEDSIRENGYAAIPFQRLSRLFGLAGLWQRRTEKIDNIQRLLEVTCQVLVEIDDYNYAWAVVPMPAGEGRLQVSASADTDGNRPDEADLAGFMDEPDRPVWQVMETRRPVIVNPGDDKKLSSQRVISMVVLPLLQGDEVGGVLGLYSTARKLGGNRGRTAAAVC